MIKLVVGQCDSKLSAHVVSSWPLYYSAGADAGLDRPAFVRAGSGLAAIGERLAVIQDDAHFVALLDVVQRKVEAIALPAGFEDGRQFDDRRGNRQWKLDLEACTSIVEDGRELLLALGSGSTPARAHVLLISWPPREAAAPWPPIQEDLRLVHVPKFYAAMRSQVDFAGSELNIEGAVFLGGDCLRLLQRGNGAACQGRVAVNATCDVSWQMLRAHLDDPTSPPPTPRNIVQYDLGSIDGTRLSFTDAAVRRVGPASRAGQECRSARGTYLTGGLPHDDDAFFFTATAEASPNAVEDGPVAGSVLGRIDADGKARWTVLCDPHGHPLRSKVEGLCFDKDYSSRAWIMIDCDDPLAPAELCEVLLQGNWNDVEARDQ